MKSYKNIWKNIEHLGERYCKKYLDIWDKKRLENDWWEALKFFFSHSFMRGRRDKLSNEYYHFTIKSIEDYFSITTESLGVAYEKLKKEQSQFDRDSILKFKRDKNIGRKNSIKHPDFMKEVALRNPIVNLLVTEKKVEVKWDNITYKKKIFLGNDADVMMVLDVLKFISDKNNKNIYKSLRDRIVNSGVKGVYEELTKMRSISDKIAAFIIRDIGLMNSEIEIKSEDYKLAFPIDTWVVKIANKLGCSCEDLEEIKNCLINKCKESHVEPLKFAAGLWFLGFHSLDILLENCLGKVEIENIA